jgi:hypothetical protein
MVVTFVLCDSLIENINPCVNVGTIVEINGGVIETWDEKKNE